MTISCFCLVWQHHGYAALLPCPVLPAFETQLSLGGHLSSAPVLSFWHQLPILHQPPSEDAAEGAYFAGLRVYSGRPCSFNAQACQ